MKNAKLIAIISIVLAVALIACGFVFSFKKDAVMGPSLEMRVELNEEFDIADVEAIMKEAGADDCVVTAQAHAHEDDVHTGTIADILFTADDVMTVADKAEELMGEKYFLKYEASHYSIFPTFSKKNIIALWPALIVLAVLAVYAFIRFGAKYALAALIALVEAAGATAGIVALTGLRFTSYTLGIFLASGTVALLFALAFALTVKDNEKKLSGKDEAFAASSKTLTKLAVLALGAAAIGLCIVLIFGGSLLKNMAITSLIAVVANILVAVFAVPAMVKTFGKEK